MPVAVENTPLAEDHAAGATAILIIDMLSGWDFPDAQTLLSNAQLIAPRIARLRERCKARKVPVVYANDNQGRWRSDFREVVALARDHGGAGAAIAVQLAPDRDDYFVLKPKHSGFHATPLDLLLRHLRVRKLLITGVSSDQCVLYTAADARMHDYTVSVPSDCIATLSAERNRRALQHMEEVLRVDTTPSEGIDVPLPD
jgi:nicotinamidase-related amidase